MTWISMSLDKFMFGNEHWRSYRAADEIEIYCDVLEFLQGRIESLETRGKDEEVTLVNVQAVNSSYALEIAIKSLWALDHPDDTVLRTHDLLELFDGLNEQTQKALERLHWTKSTVEGWPKPFLSNRYSMEEDGRVITVYPSLTLRPLAQLLRDKTEEAREALLEPLRSTDAHEMLDLP